MVENPLVVFLGFGAAVAIAILVYDVWRRTDSQKQQLSSLLSRLSKPCDLIPSREEVVQVQLPEAPEFRVTSSGEVYLVRHRRKPVEKADSITTGAVMAGSSKLDEIVAKKRSRLLNVPSIAFQFADKQQIESFYNDYFREPTIESLISEVLGEAGGEVSAGLPQVLESRIGTKDLTKWVSEIRVSQLSVSGMFQRYQRETVKSGEVSLGIEEVDIELSEIQAFNEAVAGLEKRFNFELAEAVLEEQRTRLRQKAATRTLEKLESATGWVLVEGRFRIEDHDEFYKCAYLHPVNKYLPEQTGPVTISILLRKDSLEPRFAGNYAQSVGGLIPLRVYGQVWEPIDIHAKSWELRITPLAVY